MRQLVHLGLRKIGGMNDLGQRKVVGLVGLKRKKVVLHLQEPDVIELVLVHVRGLAPKITTSQKEVLMAFGVVFYTTSQILWKILLDLTQHKNSN